MLIQFHLLIDKFPQTHPSRFSRHL